MPNSGKIVSTLLTSFAMKKKNILKIALATCAIVFATVETASARTYHTGSCVDGIQEVWSTYSIGGYDTGIYIPGSLQQYGC